MEPKKPLSGLIRDIFTFFQVKYGNLYDKAYEAYEGDSPDHAQVARLFIPGCPDWASPCLVLKFTKFRGEEEDLELTLSGIAPTPGHNDNFHGKLMQIWCKFEKTSTLWLSASDTIGGLGRVIKFDEEGKVLSSLRLELMTKAHELYYSGVYDTKLKTLVS